MAILSNLNSLVTDLKKKSYLAYAFTRSALYMGQFESLYRVSKAFSPLVEVPTPYRDKTVEEFLMADVKSLYEEDAKLFIEKISPWVLLKPESLPTHFFRFSKILASGVKMSKIRKEKTHKKFKPSIDLSKYPDYFKRTFHFQVDGYLSTDSAELYNHQVEIIFNGTADAMRRMVIPVIHDALMGNSQKKILEIACGTGRATEMVAKSFTKNHLTATDLSHAYLVKAREKLNLDNVDFMQAAAEELPFKDETYDIVYSVFLFHEIPEEVREKAVAEMKRVLKPGGTLIILDSIQVDDEPRYHEALRRFPIDYHEPFYKSYTQWPLEKALADHGFQSVESKRGFFSKIAWGKK